MLRCIENAIRHGHITREAGEALQDRVDRLLQEGLSPPQVREQMANELAVEAALRKRRGLLQEARRRELTEFLLTHRNARGENDPAHAFMLLHENFGDAAVKDIETTRLVILARAHAELEGLLYEFRKGAWTGDLRRRRGDVAARLENVVREVFGQDTGDPVAKALAKAWGEVSERLRLRYNAAGGHIGKLERDDLRWGLNQAHEPEALLNAEFNGTKGKHAWVEYLMQPGVLDRERMTRIDGTTYSDGELREALGNIWERIVSEGWTDREPSYVAYGKGALGKQRDDHHRFLHFASPDAWLAYQKNFGNPDPFSSMIGHIARMARDIATMEVLGPAPEAMRNYLKQVVLKQAAVEKPIGRVVEDIGARLAALLDSILDKREGRAWLGQVQAKVGELAELQRRLRALPDDDGGTPPGQPGVPSMRQALEAGIRDASQEIENLKRALTMMEGRAAGELRAKLLAEQRQVRAEIDNIEAKSAPQLDGLSRRNRRKIAKLRAREADLADQIDLLEQTDTSVAAQHPDVHAELVGLIDRVVAEDIRIDRVTGLAALDGYRSVPNPLDAARTRIATADAMWDLIRGTHYAPVNSRWANAMQTARNIMTAALLGSASVSSLTDVGFQRHARTFAGMPAGVLNIIAETVRAFSPSNRREAVRAGLMLDSAMHVLHAQARYIDGINTASWSGFVADRIISYSGLSAWTQAGKHAFGMALQGEIADRVQLSWGELPPVLRRSFERHGITAAEWDRMRSAPLYEPHEGATFLRPNEVAAVAGDALAEKYLGMILRETRYAVPEGTVRSRTWLWSGRPGTILGELGRNFGQFKSFGVGVVLLHGGRIAHEFQRGNVGNTMSLVAGLAITGAIGGAIVNELIEIINGREPVAVAALRRGEMPGWEYWGAALLRAGGMGIYGDVLFQGLSREGGFASILIGPLGGFLDRIRTRTLGSAQEGLEGKNMHLGREAVSTLRELMPGSTLWYLRLVKERWLLNLLQRAVDPNAERAWSRHQTLQKRNYGNEYWWKPGDLAPARLPWQAARPTAPAAPERIDTGPQYEVGQRLQQTADQRIRVIDGDTVDFGGRHWRLVGFDTPEIYSKRAKIGDRVAGMQAALRLGELLRSGRAELEVTDRPDRWGRGRARLTIDGRDVAEIMNSEKLIKRTR